MSDPTPQADEPENTGEVLAEKAKSAYRWWDNLARFNAEDPLWLGALKIGFRALGILFMIAISPFILLGVLLAFMAVS